MIKSTLPDPIPVPWTMKPLASAETSLEILDDGRMHLRIRHEVVRSVTPEMLVWWFNNIEGDCEVEGQRYPRYRIWHPLDHVALRYVRRTSPIGPGARFHIHEVLGRNPAWRVNVETDIVRLDTGGFIHRPRAFGLPVRLVEMSYTFERVRGGTQYTNSMTVGLASRVARPLNELLRARLFTEAHGRAWLKHNVEEVGNFEFFLPQLVALI